MQMLHQHVTQIVIATQRAHDLGDRTFQKSPLGFQSDGQQIRQHLDEQSRVESIAVQTHVSHMQG